MLGAALILSKMKIDQWKSQDEIEEMQDAALSRLVSYAAERVPYYKGLKGIRKAGLDGLPSLPIIRKADVRAHLEWFISSAFSRESLAQVNTSGSSGMQVRLYRSPRESAYGIAFEAFHLTECGIGPLDMQVRITDYESRPNSLQRLGFFRCAYLPVQGDESRNFEALSRISPQAIISYPSILLPLARMNAAAPLHSAPKAVFTSGEVLTSAARKIISSSFECPVYDRYGSVETSWVAWECPKGSMHVNMGGAVVEIVDGKGRPARDGDVGDLLVTPLWLRSMPIIRYCTGDRASFGPKCACGRGLRVIRAIEGREDDCVVLPSGRVRSARSINIMDDIRGILSYQIVQERPELFVFRFVPQGAGPSGASKDEISRRIRAGCLGEEVIVEFESVPSIDRGKTGKRRAVISNVGKGRTRGTAHPQA